LQCLHQSSTSSCASNRASKIFVRRQVISSNVSVERGSNVVRYRRQEGRGLAQETEEIQGHEKGQFDGTSPAVRKHALLGLTVLGVGPELNPV